MPTKEQTSSKVCKSALRYSSVTNAISMDLIGEFDPNFSQPTTTL